MMVFIVVKDWTDPSQTIVSVESSEAAATRLCEILNQHSEARYSLIIATVN